MFFAILAGLLLFVQANHVSGRRTSQARADLQLETELQQEIARLKASESPPTWTAPRLPYSVMAGIWTYRMAGSTGPAPPAARFHWHYRRETAYVIAAALLALRDAGLIIMSIDSTGAVRIARTGVPVTSAEMPAVEGGLLTALDELAHQRFGRTTTPGAAQLVMKFVHGGSDDPYQRVIDLAVQDGSRLGLYVPATKRGGLRGGKPRYWLEHLAACDDQVVAFTNRWREFGISDPELQGLVLAEADYAIGNRASSGG